MLEDGYITLSRKYFKHFFWKENREFSKSEAWLDLIQQARFAPEAKLLNGRRLSLKRGELVASVRYLSNRWLWSKSKVSRFLDLLKSEKMIQIRQEEGHTIITLLNYESYNVKISGESETDTKPGQQSGHLPGQLEPDKQRGPDQTRDTLRDSGEDTDEDSGGTNIKEGVNKGKKKDKKKERGLFDVWTEFPQLDTPDMRDAWADKEEHRKQKKLKPLTEIGMRKQFKIFQDWGAEKSIQAINESIANDYQGIFEPKANNETNRQKSRNDGTFNKGKTDWSKARGLRTV